MKNVVKILVLALSVGVFGSFSYKAESAEDLKWQNWNTGYPMVKEGKIGLIDVYTDWCGWCKRMDRDTYAKKAIIEKINKSFVPIKFNPELSGTYYVDSTAYSGPQLYSMLSNNNPSGFPTTYFIIPQGNVMHVRVVPGYQSAENFEGILDKIVTFATTGEE